MKKDGMTLLQIDKEDLKKLIAEVKETVAGLIHLPTEKKMSFGAAGLIGVNATTKALK
jgi:hypothetical protein